MLAICQARSMQGTATVDAIHGEYQMSAREFLGLVPSLTRSRPWFVVGGAFLLVCSLLAIADAADGNAAGLVGDLIGIGLGMAIASGWFSVPFYWWAMRGRREMFEAPVVVDASPERLGLSASYGSSASNWSSFRPGGRETPTMFVLVNVSKSKVPIPKRAFADTDVAAFGRLLRDKGLIR